MKPRSRDVLVRPRLPHGDRSYIERLLEMQRQGVFPSGRVTHVLVRHSEICGFFVDGACSCNPDLELYPEVA